MSWKKKEAIAQPSVQNINNNNNIVPETSNSFKKRHKPTPSDNRLESIASNSQSTENMENMVLEILKQNNNSHTIMHTQSSVDIDDQNSVIDLVDLNLSISSMNRINESNIAMKSLYLTKLPTDTTSEDLLQYIRLNGDNINTGDLKLHKLIKKNADLSALSFISYKIDAPVQSATILQKTGFWPSSCIIKEFVNKNKLTNSRNNDISKSFKNFLIATPMHTIT